MKMYRHLFHSICIVLLLIFFSNMQCIYAQETNDFLMLLNESTKISSDYKPIKTINLSEYIPCTATKMLLQKDAGNAFIKMYNALLDSGIKDLKVCSAYRSFSTQKYIFNDKLAYYKRLGYSDENAYNIAKSIVAIPSTSEHQTGLAVDVTIHGDLEQAFENTDASKWLKENSYKYGFILSFPDDKQDITGIIYEPWHYRYVGITHAKIIYENNWCLPEYINYLKTAKIHEQRDKEDIVRIYYGNDNLTGTIVEISNSNTGKNIITTVEKFDPLKYVHGHWAEKEILEFVKLGQIKNDDYIKPDSFITRGMFVSFLDSICNTQSKREYVNFNDVLQDHKYYSSIKSVYEKELIFGNCKYFRPDDFMTREEMAVMLSRAMNFENLQFINYKDISNISGWAFQDIQKLCYVKVLNAYEDNTIRPKNNVTLAEAVSCISKLKFNE